MRILVIGSRGQLGMEIVSALSAENDVIGLNSDELDITGLEDVIEKVSVIKPDIIINSAAYTKVDDCEDNIDLAYKINAIGVKNIAIASLKNESPVLHISTDYVFDGENDTPYLEFDNPNPINIYGKSKFAGEVFLKDICSKYYILRTSWLYGKYGNNFVKTIINKVRQGNELSVVNDQRGCPTCTTELVKFIKFIIRTEAYGLYHAAGEGHCTWNEFAKKILYYAGYNDINVKLISSDDLNLKAKRPKYSVMRNYMAELQFDYRLNIWEDTLKAFIETF